MKKIREELAMCLKLLRESEDICERIERLRSMMERTTTTLRTDAGGNRQYFDMLGEGIARLDELERAYASKCAAYIARVQLAEALIDSVRAADQRRVLRMRYIDGMAWERICAKMGYSMRTCYNLHDEGLRELS